MLTWAVWIGLGRAGNGQGVGFRASASRHARYHPGRYESERWLEVGGGNLRAAGALRPH